MSGATVGGISICWDWLVCSRTALPELVISISGGWKCPSVVLFVLNPRWRRVGLSSARTVMRPTQKATAQTAENNLEICMFFFYANLCPDATAFPAAGKNCRHSAWERITQRRPRQNPAHFASGNFDALLQFQHVGGAQSFNRLDADQNRPGAGKTDAHLPERQRIRVIPTGRQMRFRHVEVFDGKVGGISLHSPATTNRRVSVRLLPVCPPANNIGPCANPPANRAGC